MLPKSKRKPNAWRPLGFRAFHKVADKGSIGIFPRGCFARWNLRIHVRFRLEGPYWDSVQGESAMRIAKVLLATMVAGFALAATSSGASAQWYHHRYYHRGPGPVLGLVGGVIVGAATIATLPFAILGAAVRPAEPPPPAYYPPPPGPPPRYYGPRAYGPGAYGPPGYYAPPPPGYYRGY